MKKQLSDEQLRKLKNIDSPTVSNAIEQFHLRPPNEGFIGMEIRCLFPKLGVMVGHALTLTADATTIGEQKEQEELDLPEMLQAIKKTPKPVILFIKTIGLRLTHSCVFGDVMAATAKQMGAIGLVTDGGVRDIKNIRKMGFHLFAQGVVPSHGTFSIKKIDIPISISGVEICTGDLIHGDENGVIKVPWNCVDKLPETAQELSAQEEKIVNFAKSSNFSIEKLKRRFH